MHIPISTYRLQLNKQFDFRQAEIIVPYLKRLGISDVYTSPILQAQTNSSHGYDVIDPQKINSELGGLKAFKRFADILQKQQLSLLVDIVPNHMAATEQNVYWLDVQKNRQQSLYQHWFDIDWQVSKQQLVYRRFFDINELVCLHAEDNDVFLQTHACILELINAGYIQGLRIDHIDGLRKPQAYLERLRSQLAQDTYIIVEKILAWDEHLPQPWPIAGTTGYDFLTHVNRLLIEPQGLMDLLSIYSAMTQESHVSDEQNQSLHLIIHTIFNREFSKLLNDLHQLIGGDIVELKNIFVKLITQMRRYRYYTHENRIDDNAQLTKRLDNLQSSDDNLLQRFKHIILLNFPASMNSEQKNQWKQWHTAWEVFTGPVMAKSFEDTTCYSYNACLALNDVGSGIECFTTKDTLNTFHTYNINKQKQWPYSLNTTSTHDTKRSEDVRARLCALSELNVDWRHHLNQWIERNLSKKTLLNQHLAPDTADEIFLYQTLLGVWPLQQDEFSGLRGRLFGFLEKALRERKRHSTWANPNPDYEQAMYSFLQQLLDDKTFLASFLPFQERLAYLGMLNSLTQLVLKMTCPGIPDIYQGNETWRFDLVDPDNRREIDYLNLFELECASSLPELLHQWQDGRIKFNLTKQLLSIRSKYSEIFQHGDYLPALVTGIKHKHVIAFYRKFKDQAILVVSTRWFSKLLNNKSCWSSNDFFKEAGIIVPNKNSSWLSLLEHKTYTARNDQLTLNQLLNHLPFNILMVK